MMSAALIIGLLFLNTMPNVLGSNKLWCEYKSKHETSEHIFNAPTSPTIQINGESLSLSSVSPIDEDVSTQKMLTETKPDRIITETQPKIQQHTRSDSITNPLNAQLVNFTALVDMKLTWNKIETFVDFMDRRLKDLHAVGRTMQLSPKSIFINDKGVKFTVNSQSMYAPRMFGWKTISPHWMKYHYLSLHGIDSTIVDSSVKADYYALVCNFV